MNKITGIIPIVALACALPAFATAAHAAVKTWTVYVVYQDACLSPTDAGKLLGIDAGDRLSSPSEMVSYLRLIGYSPGVQIIRDKAGYIGAVAIAATREQAGVGAVAPTIWFRSDITCKNYKAAMESEGTAIPMALLDAPTWIEYDAGKDECFPAGNDSPGATITDNGRAIRVHIKRDTAGAFTVLVTNIGTSDVNAWFTSDAACKAFRTIVESNGYAVPQSMLK